MAQPENEAIDFDGATLDRLLRGYQFTQALFVAADLSIPDLVADGPTDVSVLAARCGAHPASLERLLRALTSLGVFAETDPGVFGPTSLSEALRDGVAGSRRAWLAFHAVDLYKTWAELGHSVRSGATATSLVYGMDSWTWRSLHPEQEARFDAAMSEASRSRVTAFVASYDMTPFRTVVDVGGGHGALVAGILGACPTSRGILFDQPHVVAGAPELLTSAGVADRVDVVAGDFFSHVPRGGDAYLLSLVLHDWDDDRAGVILERCRHAMAGGSVLLLYERVLPPGPDRPWDPYFSDLNMLQGPGGRERTETEWRTLLTAAGFDTHHTVPTPVGVSIIESSPS